MPSYTQLSLHSLFPLTHFIFTSLFFQTHTWRLPPPTCSVVFFSYAYTFYCQYFAHSVLFIFPCVPLSFICRITVYWGEDNGVVHPELQAQVPALESLRSLKQIFWHSDAQARHAVCDPTPYFLDATFNNEKKNERSDMIWVTIPLSLQSLWS